MPDDAFAAACRVLGVATDADREAIDRAYAERKLLYAEDSLATYALLSEEERREQIERLEAAHRRAVEHLERASGSDPDGAPPGTPAGGTGTGRSEDTTDRPEKVSTDLRDATPSTSRDSAPGSSTGTAAPASPDAGGDGADVPPTAERPIPPAFAPGESPGAYLRRCREAAGLDLSRLAEETRISARHLANLEADGFGELRAEVYVRGFVTTYARALRVSPSEPLVAAFLDLYRAAHSS